MIFYIIEDNPNTIRSLTECFKSLKIECYWIDSVGDKRKDTPSRHHDFVFELTDNFSSKLCPYIKADNLFLVDLALNDDERLEVIEATDSIAFNAKTAALIIKTLKESKANVLVISSIWRYRQLPLWKNALNDISKEGWFGELNFMQTALVKAAKDYENVKMRLYSYARGEKRQ